MSSTTTTQNTITSPMTAIFTPPSSCSSHWTFEPEAWNSVSGGLLLQDAVYNTPDVSCFPSGFDGWGRAPSFIQIFSPGACPVGYTTAANFDGSTIKAVCCPSAFIYTTTVSTVNAGNKTAEYYGCTSIYPESSGPTVVFAEISAISTTLSDGHKTLVTTVTGPVTMWAQPITVAYRSFDASLFATTTAPSTSASSMSASSTTTPASSSSPASVATISDSSLSGGAIAGIAIGCTLLLCALLVLAFFLWRRKKAIAKPIQWPSPGTHPDQDMGDATSTLRSQLPNDNGVGVGLHVKEDQWRMIQNRIPVELDPQYGQRYELS